MNSFISRALPEDVADRLQKQVCEKLFSGASVNIESAKAVWRMIPADRQKQSLIAFHVARMFYRAGWLDESRDILIRALNENWDADLMCAFAEFSSDEKIADLEERIRCCKQWKEKYSIYPQWMLALGELYYRQNRSEQARYYLGKVMETQPETSLWHSACFLLAKMREKSGRPEKNDRPEKQASQDVSARNGLLQK